MLAAACNGGSDPTPTPTTPATATVPAATATPDPLASTNVDAALVFEHARVLSEDIGPRVAGTDGEIAGRDYIAEQLTSYGYDVTIDDFPYDASAFLPSLVTVGAQAFPAIALNGSPAVSASGALVTAGMGRTEEFPPGGIAGKIAVIERGDLTFSDKAANAIATGAAGVIIYNNEEGSLLGQIAPVDDVPVVAVTQEVGAGLVAAASSGATATVEVSPPRGTAFNVIARPKGETECTTVTGGHHDSVPIGRGAEDNASGAAAVLEVARVMAARGATSGNCFVLFGAEEVGLIGSRAFVADLDAGARATLRGMVNIDVVGVDARMSLIGNPDLVDVARIAADAAGIEAAPAELPSGSGSDHMSFEAAGIAVIMFNRPDGQIHTPDDTIARIVPERLAESVELAIAVLETLKPAP